VLQKSYKFQLLALKKIIPESLHMLKVPAHWIFKNRSAHDLCQWVASSLDLLVLYTGDKELFL